MQILRRMRVQLFVIGLLLAAGPSQAVPKFSDSLVSTRFRGIPARIRLGSRQARLYRTVLKHAEARGPNFAGHYTLATWGAGAEGWAFAIIDARTGVVYFTTPSWVKLGPNSGDPLQFRRNSCLLILTGFVDLKGYDSGQGNGIFYYTWTGHHLRLVRAVHIPYMRAKSGRLSE